MQTIKAHRFGDYYETVDDDARTLSAAVGITLTKPGPRWSGPFKDAKAMCGFPIRSLESIRADLEQVGIEIKVCTA